jgi:hypothetical protein
VLSLFASRIACFAAGFFSMMAVTSVFVAPLRPNERPATSVAKPVTSAQGDTAALSSLGRTVSAAISRSEATTEGKSDNELRAIVERAKKHLDDNWRRDAGRFAKEVPKGADEGRLVIARQATSYIDQLTTLPRAAGVAHENPFFGLGRAELAAIQYDESGSFTTNERRAAASEAGRQYGEWSAEVCARGLEEHSLTGRSNRFLSEVLAYFDALPAIERAALPKGYMDRLRSEASAPEKDDTHGWPEHLSMALPRPLQGDNPAEHSP